MGSSKDPRAGHVALPLAPTGGNVVELAAAQDAAALNVIPAKAGIQGILVPRSTWESWTPAFAPTCHFHLICVHTRLYIIVNVGDEHDFFSSH